MDVEGRLCDSIRAVGEAFSLVPSGRNGAGPTCHAGRWRCDSRSSLFLCHYTPRRASIGAKRILAVAVANFHGHAAKHPNPHHFKLIHPRGTRATKALWLMLHKREARAYSQHQVVRFAILGTAVKPHRGVQADEVCIAGLGRIPALVAVGAPAGHHVALAAENIIDLFLHLVVMRSEEHTSELQ